MRYDVDEGERRKKVGEALLMVGDLPAVGRSGLGGTLLCQAPLRCVGHWDTGTRGWDSATYRHKTATFGGEWKQWSDKGDISTSYDGKNDGSTAAVVIYSLLKPEDESGKLGGVCFSNFRWQCWASTHLRAASARRR